MTKTDFHLRFRPDSFDNVIGQGPVVKALKAQIEEGTQHSFIFTGPSGTGKTTLSRILAREVGADERNILEVDAATNTGVDAMREIKETFRYKPLGAKAKVIIVDEAHALTKAAWQSLLKDVEEPPSYGYWCFCTTEESKIPETIKTRCAQYKLRPVSREDLFDLLSEVCKEVGGGPDDDILSLVTEVANGSPRLALTLLSTVFGAADVKEAAKLMSAASQEGEVIDICRLLAKGQLNWGAFMKILGSLDSTNPEGIRLQITAYFTKVVLGTRDFSKAGPSLAILDAFGQSYGSAQGLGPVLVSLGTLFNE